MHCCAIFKCIKGIFLPSCMLIYNFCIINDSHIREGAYIINKITFQG